MVGLLTHSTFNFSNPLRSRNCSRLDLTCEWQQESSLPRALPAQDSDSVSLLPGSIVRTTSLAALAPRELRIFHHMSQMTNDLWNSNVHELALGRAGLPVFIQLALENESCRWAWLAQSASHIRSLAPSEEISNLCRLYRVQAFASLQRAIDVFSPQNSDSVLAASILLSWDAAGR